MEEILKCKICKSHFDIDQRSPLVIKCGHTFCKQCILNKNEDTCCPLCGINIIFKLEFCPINSFAEEVLIFFSRDTKKQRAGNQKSIDLSNFQLNEKSNPPGSPTIYSKDHRLSSLLSNTKLIEGRRNTRIESSPRERSPIERCLTYSDNNENNIKTSLNGLNNIITIKLNEHQARSNSGHKYYDRNFERSVTEDNKKIISSANKLCYRNTFDIPQKEEISEKTEDDNSLDTITLYDDKSVFDHSFQDDFKEFIQKGRERVQNYNELVQNTNSENKNNIKLIKSELGADARPSTGSGSSTPHTSNFNNNLNINININSNSLSNYSLEEKLKEEIYKSIQDPTKRKKYEDYIMRGLKTATLSSPSKTSPNSSPNSNKQISYQIIEKDFILGYLEKNKTSKGVIFSENGDLYEGEFLNGKKDGYGVIIYKNGTKYEGIFKLNKQHGYGKLFQCDGEIYIGEWKEGRINGNGVRYHSNGDKYTGQYINNIRNGAGTYLFANGDCYEGNWTNGKASGKGKFSYSNGNFYEGEFVENQICGKGIFTCANGDVYRGTFKNGLITGQGMLKTYKGETFQGEFFKGKKHGFGNLYSLEGILMYSGFWNQDNYVGKKNPIS